MNRYIKSLFVVSGLFCMANCVAEGLPYKAILVPPTKQSTQGIDQQLLAEKLFDAAYSTVDGARLYIHFDPAEITTYAPAPAMVAGKSKPKALIISGFNKQIFIINNPDKYPFVALLFNQKRGIQQGAPLKPAKSTTELKNMGIEFTKLSNMKTLLKDARAALIF